MRNKQGCSNFSLHLPTYPYSTCLGEIISQRRRSPPSFVEESRCFVCFRAQQKVLRNAQGWGSCGCLLAAVIAARAGRSGKDTVLFSFGRVSWAMVRSHTAPFAHGGHPSDGSYPFSSDTSAKSTGGLRLQSSRRASPSLIGVRTAISPSTSITPKKARRYSSSASTTPRAGASTGRSRYRRGNGCAG